MLGGPILALFTLLAGLGGIDIDVNPAQKMRTHWAEHVLDWDTTEAEK